MAILRVKAGVCEKCGERFRSELKQKTTEMYKPIGRTYVYEGAIK